MNAKLSRLNDKMSRIEPYYVERDASYFVNMTLDERKTFMSTQETYKSQYISYLQEARDLFPQLTPQELVDCFDDVCEILRQQIGVYMRHNYDQKYLEVMVKEIRSGKNYSSRLLAGLVDNLGMLSLSYIILALNSSNPKIQEIAIGAVENLNLIELKPIIERLTKSHSPLVVESAQLTLKHLESLQ